MTWQRIDDEIYIDDTLVTCAEYQLFIDEMREQDKYCQPDHWTTYQFPNGQALEPISGVRPSDAIAFCEWLTQREDREWEYRLPLNDEVTDAPLKHQAKAAFGYWTNKSTVDSFVSSFKWIGINPLNPRGFDNDISKSQMFSRLVEENFLIELENPKHTRLNFQQVVNDTSFLDSDNTFSLVKSFAEVFLSGFGIFSTEFNLYRATDRVRNITLWLDGWQNFVININRTPPLSLVHRVEGTPNQLLEFDRALGSDRNLSENRLAKLELACKISSVYACILDRTIMKHRDQLAQMCLSEDDFLLPLKSVYRVLIDLYTIQERIAGRSPAFEGIRLVKERIQ